LDEDATTRIARSIEKINAELPPVSQIVKYFITTVQLTRDNGFMTRNLKLDRRAIFRHFKKDLLGNLAPHEKSRERHDVATATLTATGAPQTEFEQSICAIWQEVLQTEPVGLNDNFFELGGNSLLLAEIQRKMQDKLGQAVPLAEMFNHPTVGSMAKYLASPQQQQEEQTAPQPALQRINDRAERQREALSRQRQSRERKKVS
jgi:acyl carrier protein